MSDSFTLNMTEKSTLYCVFVLYLWLCCWCCCLVSVVYVLQPLLLLFKPTVAQADHHLYPNAHSHCCKWTFDSFNRILEIQICGQFHLLVISAKLDIFRTILKKASSKLKKKKKPKWILPESCRVNLYPSYMAICMKVKETKTFRQLPNDRTNEQIIIFRTNVRLHQCSECPLLLFKMQVTDSKQLPNLFFIWCEFFCTQYVCCHNSRNI